MRPLRSGQDTVLSWRTGAIECRVVAAAGHYVLLRPDRRLDSVSHPSGVASLTYLDGRIPMGWDGLVEPGGEPGELRFRVADPDRGADRRSSVRVPLAGAIRVAGDGEKHAGRLLDVSAGGMRFRHTGRFRHGQLLEVWAALPHDVVIDATAVVRAAEQGVTSVEFTELRGADGDTVGRWTVAILRASLSTGT